jgi:hypothetical protein
MLAHNMSLRGVHQTYLTYDTGQCSVVQLLQLWGNCKTESKRSFTVICHYRLLAPSTCNMARLDVGPLFTLLFMTPPLTAEPLVKNYRLTRDWDLLLRERVVTCLVT